MHNSDWIAVFRQFPVDLHPQLILVLQNRTEVAVEALFRLEPTFLVARGRMGGTTETGVLFLVPFDQLAAVYLYRGLKEAEVEAIFGPPKSVSQLTSRSALAARAAAPAPPPQHQPAPTPPPGPAPTPAAMPAFGRPPEATAVARNNLLERLRAARHAAMPPSNGK